MKKVFLILLAIVLAMSMVVVGCPEPVEQEEEEEEEPEVITLSFANFPPAPTFPCVSMFDWAEKVEERTDGQVVVECFPGSTLLSPPAMFDGVAAGVADIGCTCPSYEPGRFPLIVGMETPEVLYPGAEVASQVLWEACETIGYEVTGLTDWKVVTLYTAGLNHLCTIDKVETLEDLAGMEIRCSGAVVPIVEALGAVPVDLPQSEVPEALAKGTIQGYVSSDDVLKDFAFAEIVNYRTDWSPSIGCSFAVVMNWDSWNALPADVQQVIDDLALEHSIWTGEYLDAHCEVALTWAIDEHGLEVVTLSPEEKARWDAAIEPVTAAWLANMEAEGLPGQEWLDLLAELSELYS
ncbi:MAG: TRAP transporter substrate-binding protein [Dehalococcoidia bacterium]